jgi:exosortase
VRFVRTGKLDAKILLLTGVVAAAWGALYFDTLRRLVDDWRVDENYSHGFLIPVVSAYAIWKDRDQIFSTKPTPRLFLGAALMLIAALMLFAGIAGAELYIARVSVVLSLAALVVYFRGTEWLRRLVFPIGLLLLAIPVPSIVFNQIAFPMQLMASDYATRAIRLFGVPALREGNVIELAQMKLQVVEACSGIRSLMTLAALAVVYAHFAEKRWTRRIALVVAVIPIAIVANAARVAGTGVMAHAWGIQAAEGFLHGFSGLLVFIVAVLLLLAFARMMSWAEMLIQRRQKLGDQFQKSSAG